MKDNRMTYNRFAALCGSSPTVLYRNLTGETEITKRTIDKILEVTGLSYEEAFYSGEDFRCETTTIASSSASDPVN